MPRAKLTVYQIDFKYRKYLRKICINALTYYRGIPLTWEDIYNNFLYEAPKLLEEYEETDEISEQTFLGVKCKFFAYNYCRSFQTNKHRIMNDSVVISRKDHSSVSDYSKVTLAMDTSIFTKDELTVYNSHYLEGKTYTTIKEETGLTIYKIRAICQIIQSKMFSKLKN